MLQEKINGYTKFDYRRIFVWGDFLEEMEVKYPVDFLGKEEQNTLRKLIDKGNELQEQLNENYIGGISFEYYVRKLNACIGKQDIIIEHIKGFRTDLQKWLKEQKDEILLFGTKTCPNCTVAKKLLDKNKVKYKFVDAEENVKLTKELKVKQAPTLVIIKDGKTEVIANLSNIKKHIESFKI